MPATVWKIILIFHIYLKNVKNLWIVLLHFYISNSWIYNRNGLVLRWHFSCSPSHTTTFLLTHCAKLPSLRKHVSKSYRNLDEATEILTPHAPLFSRVHIGKKNCAIYYSFLLFESTIPKLLWINHKVLEKQDIYLEKPIPMM